MHLTTYSPQTLKQVRRRIKRTSQNLRCTYRHGTLYTRRFTAPVQPRTESQQRNWSLFTEANTRVAADFADPQKKALWLKKAKQQSRYKTARGLAKAFYINMLKNKIKRQKQNIHASNKDAARSLHIIKATTIHPDLPPQTIIATQQQSWTTYRNIHWFRQTLKSIT